MSLENLILRIQTFESDLPGWKAQSQLSPPYRLDYDLEEIKKNNPRIAAVMILMYENDSGEIEFPITLRHIYNGVHSNQYSLPGGSFEPEDLNLEFTAQRETCEELGLDEERIEIVRQLTELFIPPSNFLVYPYIGMYHGLPEFLMDEREVAEIIPIDLEAFLQAKPRQFEKSFAGQPVDIPGYEIGENEFIWGATAMILSEFASLIKMI